MMALPVKKNSIMSFADRILYYMSQTYVCQARDDFPDKRGGWDAIETLIAYYMTRGNRFA